MSKPKLTEFDPHNAIKECGCIVRGCRCESMRCPEPFYIEFCPMHEAAEEMAECLGTLVKMMEDGDWTTVELNEARALLHKTRREG